MKRIDWILFSIIILALILRLFRIEELTTYSGDQGRDLIQVHRIVIDGKPTLLGHPATIGLFNGPLYYYLLVPLFYLFRADPISGALTSVIMNSLAIIVLFLLCRRFISAKNAYIAAYLYSVSPLLVEFGRTMLPPYFAAPFFYLWLYAVLAFRQEKTAKFGLLAGIALGLLIQLHYLFGTLLVITALGIGIRGERSGGAFYLSTLSGFFLPLIPFILFELRHSFLNTKLLLMFLSHRHFSNFSFSQSLEFGLSTFGYLFGKAGHKYGILAIMLCIMLGIISYKKMTKNTFNFIIMTFSFYVIFITLVKIPAVYPAYHYFMVIILIAIPISAMVLEHLPRFFLGLTLVIFSITAFSSFDLFRDHGFTMVNGWNLTVMRSIANIITQDVGSEGAFSVASMVDGDTQAYHLRYLILANGREPLDIDQYQNADVLYLVTRDTAEDVFTYHLYEVDSLRPFALKKVWRIKNALNVVRIDRQRSS